MDTRLVEGEPRGRISILELKKNKLYSGFSLHYLDIMAFCIDPNHYQFCQQHFSPLFVLLNMNVQLLENILHIN